MLSKLDLAKGYYQFPVGSNLVEKTAFLTLYENYVQENAIWPEICFCYIPTAQWSYICIYFLVLYLDDMVLFSDSWEC